MHKLKEVLVGANGDPYRIFLHESVQRREDVLKQKIENFGGAVENDVELADFVIVKPETIFKPTVHTQRVCTERGLDDTINEAFNHDAPRARNGKAAFTEEDDENLAKYIALRLPDPQQGGRTGRAFYQELIDAPHQFPWALAHTKESWRARYMNHRDRIDERVAVYVKKHPEVLDGKARKNVRKRAKNHGMERFATLSDDENVDEIEDVDVGQSEAGSSNNTPQQPKPRRRVREDDSVHSSRGSNENGARTSRKRRRTELAQLPSRLPTPNLAATETDRPKSQSHASPDSESDDEIRLSLRVTTISPSTETPVRSRRPRPLGGTTMGDIESRTPVSQTRSNPTENATPLGPRRSPSSAPRSEDTEIALQEPEQPTLPRRYRWPPTLTVRTSRRTGPLLAKATAVTNLVRNTPQTGHAGRSSNRTSQRRRVQTASPNVNYEQAGDRPYNVIDDQETDEMNPTIDDSGVRPDYALDLDDQRTEEILRRAIVDRSGAAKSTPTPSSRRGKQAIRDKQDNNSGGDDASSLDIDLGPEWDAMVRTHRESLGLPSKRARPPPPRQRDHTSTPSPFRDSSPPLIEDHIPTAPLTPESRGDASPATSINHLHTLGERSELSVGLKPEEMKLLKELSKETSIALSTVVDIYKFKNNNLETTKITLLRNVDAYEEFNKQFIDSHEDPSDFEEEDEDRDAETTGSGSEFGPAYM